jgi:hypothetical protein
MSTPTVHRPSASLSPQRRVAPRGYWLAAIVAVPGVVGGLALGFANYRDSQRDLDRLDRTSVPGAMPVTVTAPADRVVYDEGSNEVTHDDLTITVTGPTGDDVVIRPYVGDLVYEKVDLTKGRAVATFHAEQAGNYLVQVTEVDGGQLTVGDSFARHALPGVLTGLGLASFSLIVGMTLWLITLTRTNRRDQGGQRP